MKNEKKNKLYPVWAWRYSPVSGNGWRIVKYIEKDGDPSYIDHLGRKKDGVIGEVK